MIDRQINRNLTLLTNRLLHSAIQYLKENALTVSYLSLYLWYFSGTCCFLWENDTVPNFLSTWIWRNHFINSGFVIITGNIIAVMCQSSGFKYKLGYLYIKIYSYLFFEVPKVSIRLILENISFFNKDFTEFAIPRKVCFLPPLWGEICSAVLIEMLS